MSFGHFTPNSRPVSPAAAALRTSTAVMARTCVTFGAFWFTNAVASSPGNRK